MKVVLGGGDDASRGQEVGPCLHIYGSACCPRGLGYMFGATGGGGTGRASSGQNWQSVPGQEASADSVGNREPPKALEGECDLIKL